MPIISFQPCSDNGLVLSGNKPLTEPKLTQIYVTILYHQVKINWYSFKKMLRITWTWILKY